MPERGQDFSWIDFAVAGAVYCLVPSTGIAGRIMIELELSRQSAAWAGAVVGLAASAFGLYTSRGARRRFREAAQTPGIQSLKGEAFVMHPWLTILCVLAIFLLAGAGVMQIVESRTLNGFLAGVGAIAIAMTASKYFLGEEQSWNGQIATKSFSEPATSQIQGELRAKKESLSLRAYGLLDRELSSGQKDSVLWLKCFSEADGEESKAQAAYNRMRARALEIEEESRMMDEEAKRRELKKEAELKQEALLKNEEERKRDLAIQKDNADRPLIAEVQVMVAAVNPSIPKLKTWNKEDLSRHAAELNDLIAKTKDIERQDLTAALKQASIAFSAALEAHEHDRALLEQTLDALKQRNVSAVEAAMHRRKGSFEDLNYRPFLVLLEADGARYTKKIMASLFIMILVLSILGIWTANRGNQSGKMDRHTDVLLSQNSPHILSESVPIITETQEVKPPNASVEAVKWIEAARVRNDSETLYNLGVCYYRGDGVNQSFNDAMELFKAAANQNHADAQFNIGVMHENGESCEPDSLKAWEWYYKAAQQGHAEAKFALGTLFENGEGVEQDFHRAAEWYLEAAHQGFRESQLALSDLHREGKGVIQDKAEAYKWILLADAEEDPNASRLIFIASLSESLRNEGRLRAERFRANFKETSKK